MDIEVLREQTAANKESSIEAEIQSIKISIEKAVNDARWSVKVSVNWPETRSYFEKAGFDVRWVDLSYCTISWETQ